MENYVEMTIEQAMNCCDKNTKVLVCTKELRKDTVISFEPKVFAQCEDIIKSGKTLVKCMDDFVNQLMVYTYQQDLPNVVNKGNLSTILLKE